MNSRELRDKINCIVRSASYKRENYRENWTELYEIFLNIRDSLKYNAPKTKDKEIMLDFIERKNGLEMLYKLANAHFNKSGDILTIKSQYHKELKVQAQEERKKFEEKFFTKDKIETASSIEDIRKVYPDAEVIEDKELIDAIKKIF